ncbi:hypothetical protein ACFL3Q_12080 [Planctomycetota bacterium]
MCEIMDWDRLLVDKGFCVSKAGDKDFIVVVCLFPNISSEDKSGRVR